MAKVHSKPSLVNRFVRWLFGAPFQNLPPEFGDTVPPELRVFEEEAAQAQHTERREPAGPSGGRRQMDDAVRRDESER
jgi:hypothetical protein